MAESSLRRTGDQCLEEDKQQLLQAIKVLCERQDREEVENVLLIGKSGAGKSALINTLIKAITGEYYDRAKVGRGETQSKTLRLVQYEYCGVVKEDLKVSLSKDDSGIIRKHVMRLPNVYDVPGLGNSLSDDTKEILRLLIAGRIPVGTGIPAIEKLQKEHGVGNLDIIFKRVDPKRKINKVVFVQSATDSVPKDLIAGLHDVLRETDPSARLTYEGDVFLVITHYDLVMDDSGVIDDSGLVQTLGPLEDDEDCNSAVSENSANAERVISRKDFEEKEKVLASLFSIDGAKERNRLYWRSFCDETGYEDAAISVTALRFLKFMMSPSTPSTPAPPQPVVDYRVWLEVKYRQLKNQLLQGNNFHLDIRPIYLIGVLCVAIILRWFYSYLSAPVQQSHV